MTSINVERYAVNSTCHHSLGSVSTNKPRRQMFKFFSLTSVCMLMAVVQWFLINWHYWGCNLIHIVIRKHLQGKLKHLNKLYTGTGWDELNLSLLFHFIAFCGKYEIICFPYSKIWAKYIYLYIYIFVANRNVACMGSKYSQENKKLAAIPWCLWNE